MADTTVIRYPGRAAAWGFLLGLGVFIYLTFVWPVIALDNWTSVAVKGVVVILVVMAFSVLWGMFGPAKRRRTTTGAPVSPGASLDAPAAPGYDAPPPPPPAMDPAPRSPGGEGPGAN